MGVPNFAIPNVTVSAPESGKYDVTFVDAGNAGLQANLECSWQGTNTYNKPSSAPRFAASTTIAGTKRACAVTHEALTFYKPQDGYALKESVTCSNRGDCDSGTGTCTCWEGFTGEACSAQTVFF